MPRQDDNREGTHKRGGIKVQKFLKRRIPILKWFPNYNAEDFLADCIAGLTVALTVIPQSLAYATLAGLQPQVCLIWNQSWNYNSVISRENIFYAI